MIPDGSPDLTTRTIVLIIVGAGRGPLIRAAVNASKNTSRKLKIIVIEKNPNAIVTLTSLIKVMWKFEDITLISKDMRSVELKEKADILVSELLGSLGDNELSPECLDGAQRLLKPTGISIPCNSIAYMRPVMTNRVYSHIRDTKKVDNFKKALYGSNMEINWLAYLSSVYYIDAPQELWTFEHPNSSEVIDNSRHKNMNFKCKIDCVLHGFSGYFTSQLYKDIEISILPSSHTQGMGSWYCMFIPIADPVLLKKDDSFSMEIWRKVDPSKVWYEWQVTQPDGAISELMNKDGWCHPIFLWSEMEKLQVTEE
jgi:type II protein arginine methyltransferase